MDGKEYWDFVEIFYEIIFCNIYGSFYVKIFTQSHLATLCGSSIRTPETPRGKCSSINFAFSTFYLLYAGIRICGTTSNTTFSDFCQ